jgi:hypothetical protein
MTVTVFLLLLHIHIDLKIVSISFLSFQSENFVLMKNQFFASRATNSTLRPATWASASPCTPSRPSWASLSSWPGDTSGYLAKPNWAARSFPSGFVLDFLSECGCSTFCSRPFKSTATLFPHSNLVTKKGFLVYYRGFCCFGGFWDHSYPNLPTLT